MLDGRFEPFVAGEDVEVVARVVTHLSVCLERGRRGSLRRCTAIVVGDLHENRSGNPLGGLVGTKTTQFQPDRRVDLIAPGGSGDGSVALVVAVSIKRETLAGLHDYSDHRRLAHELAGPWGAVGQAHELICQKFESLLTTEEQKFLKAGIEANLTPAGTISPFILPLKRKLKLPDPLAHKLAMAIGKNPKESK